MTSRYLTQFRDACDQHGIDPVTGSNSFQAIDAYARDRKAQHESDLCNLWWADPSLWVMAPDSDDPDPEPQRTPPVASSVPRLVEHAAIFGVFVAAFRVVASNPRMTFYRHPRRCTRKLCRSIPA